MSNDGGRGAMCGCFGAPLRAIARGALQVTEYEHGVYILHNVYEEYGQLAAFVWLAGWLSLGLINKNEYEDYAQEIRNMKEM